jgi:hypothetical protein
MTLTRVGNVLTFEFIGSPLTDVPQMTVDGSGLTGTMGVFLPAPTDALSRDPSRVYSGCWFEYDGGHVYRTNPTTLANFRPRDVRASDMNCTTAAAATALADAYLARCATEEDRIDIHLHEVPASAVNLARPGQSIGIRMIHGPGSYVDLPDYPLGTSMGIVQRTVSPAAPGLYDVTLNLAVPKLTGFHPTDVLNPTSFAHNIGLVVSPAPTPTTGAHGQTVAPTVVGTGDGMTVLFTLGSAYLTGSVRVWVDGVMVPQASITETSPSAGTITLDFAPAGASGSASAQAVSASWQVD